MKNICFYSAQVDLQGGIESVIRDLYGIFSENDIALNVVCESGVCPQWLSHADWQKLRADIPSRELQWQELFCKRKIECVFFHYIAPACFDRVIHDIEFARKQGVKCALVIHESFPSAMLLAGAERNWRRFFWIAGLCDCVCTVSKIDAKWWAALGTKALYVQNPVRVPKATANRHRTGKRVNVLWVGRMNALKQPEVALMAFARACQFESDLHLTMVGGGKLETEKLRATAAKMGLENGQFSAVEARADIADLWAEADLHLLTSVTESFCLVLAEAKSFGIPSIMFEIPFLELTVGGRGLVLCPQGDVGGLASAIVDLARDEEKRISLGHAARESLAPFTDDVVMCGWCHVFCALETGSGFVEVDAQLKLVVSQVFAAWNRYCDQNLWAVEMAREFALLFRFSMKSFAWLISCLVRGVRYLKRKFES